MNKYPDLIYIEGPEAPNPWVECPRCHSRGRLMDSFSLLAAGFNGIRPGDPDDLDVQECGFCGAKLSWHDDKPQSSEMFSIVEKLANSSADDFRNLEEHLLFIAWLRIDARKVLRKLGEETKHE